MRKLILLLVLLPAMAQAALTITARGTLNTGSGTTRTVVPSGNLPAGSMGVLAIALDNAGTAGSAVICAASMVDSAGNTWTLRQDVLFDNGAASAGVEVAFYTGNLVNGLTTAQNVVVTFSASVTSSATAIWQVSASVGSVAYVTGAAGVGDSLTPATVTTSSITNGNVVFGVTGLEAADSFTGDADTTNGTWTAHQHAAEGTGATGMSVTSQGKVVTATATQTYDTTFTSADNMLAWIQLQEVTTSVKTVLGLADASVKTVNDLANASVKTILGLP